MDPTRQLTPDYHVTGQFQPDDIAELAEQGIRTIICLRPDDESADQPDTESVAAEARAHGLSFHQIPVVPGKATDEQVQQFADIMSGAETPVLGYCRTGRRAATLWALNEADHMDTDDILGRCAEAGFDLTDIGARLDGL